MNCALYMELSAHSSMGNEEYHFTASASGLVYIMASMLWRVYQEVDSFALLFQY